MGDKDWLSDFFSVGKLKMERCLEPAFTCEHEAIRAHSVQNSNALEHIAESNHVREIKMKIVDGKPVCQFVSVGRNQASTFTGFCGKHDTALFLPIDTKPLDLDDPEQLFLLAYRAVSRELHSTMEGAARIQTAYLRLVDQGKASGSEPDEPGMEAVQHMLKAYGTWKHRLNHYDSDLLAKRYNNILHSTFLIENEKPVIAASSFFSVDMKPWGRPFASVVVNIVPLTDSTTAVIFSYHRDHSGKVRRYIAPIILAAGEMKKYELSLLLIKDAENFFISPSVVDAWDEKKRKKIETAFLSTIATERVLERVPELMIFP